MPRNRQEMFTFTFLASDEVLCGRLMGIAWTCVSNIWIFLKLVYSLLPLMTLIKIYHWESSVLFRNFSKLTLLRTIPQDQAR